MIVEGRGEGRPGGSIAGARGPEGACPLARRFRTVVQGAGERTRGRGSRTRTTTRRPGKRSPMAWFVLVVSGVLEAVWAIALSASRGFRRWRPTVVFLVALAVSMFGLGWGRSSTSPSEPGTRCGPVSAPR
ncbi:DMT family transporter [Marinactinospora thermotolerans]|uniref:DMT family transporter n=1 Tax=Marinactinospora thermotolerans TaxID=531310 RepID=UPI00373FCCDD